MERKVDSGRLWKFILICEGRLQYASKTPILLNHSLRLWLNDKHKLAQLIVKNTRKLLTYWFETHTDRVETEILDCKREKFCGVVRECLQV